MSDAEIEAYVDCGESMDRRAHTAFREALPRISADRRFLHECDGAAGRKTLSELKRICPEKIEDLLKHTV